LNAAPAKVIVQPVQWVRSSEVRSEEFSAVSPEFFERPRFHRYVVEQRRPSYRYQGDVRVGAELPEEGVTYYEVPQEYGAREYRYTIINDRPVLVDPRSHRIVEVVE
jgi:Protein of unknown function (DUF1236)